MNLAMNLEISAYYFPEKLAVREGDRELTYGLLNAMSNRVATGLINLGVVPGEHVGICAPNSVDWIIFYYGVLKAGAVAVTLLAVAGDEELSLLLNHAKPRILFTTESRAGYLAGMRRQGFLETIICTQEGEGCNMTLEALMQTGSIDFRAIDRDRLDTVAILYTGGTTGTPKGVMLTHEGTNYSCRSIAFSERSTQDDVALCFLPFNHVFGQVHIMNGTFFSAGTLVLLPAFDLDRVLTLMEEGRVTKLFAVPTIYIRLLSVADLSKRLGKVRYCFSAGASMAKEIVKHWKEVTGIDISESYGMTECMPVTFNHYYPEHHRVGSVGQAVPGVEIQIRDTTGEILGKGQEGEICVRGRNVMKGYLDNPEATEAAFWDGEWLRSGDLGYLDENGYLYIVDRLKELIITGGENVYPREVEEALYTCPGVGECAVVGLPDRQWGERVAAFIVPKEGAVIESDKIKGLLKSRMTPFKVPKDFVIVEDLPKSAAGKILKREIRRKFIEEKKA